MEGRRRDDMGVLERVSGPPLAVVAASGKHASGGPEKKKATATATSSGSLRCGSGGPKQNRTATDRT